MARTNLHSLARRFGQAGRAKVALAGIALVQSLAFGLGCTPSIGDKCVLSTDCSLRGDRLCDTSEPGGYCTIFNCRGNLCPDTAACVLFNANVQGCGYDDRSASRTGRTFCMAQCKSNTDCRNGYICADPRALPWSAVILDDDQLQLVCIVPPDIEPTSGKPIAVSRVDAGVCGVATPPVPPIDASREPPDTGTDSAPVDAAPVDAGTADAGIDAGMDAADAGLLDAADAGG